MKNFERASKNLVAAKTALSAAVEKDFPIGSAVFYNHGDNERWGRVMMHSYDRVRIMTPSQKQVWIDAYRITRVRI